MEGTQDTAAAGIGRCVWELSDLQDKIPDLETLLGYEFQERTRLAKALTHSSHLSVQSQLTKSYERLEFLGDSALGLVVSSYLYVLYPDAAEGKLTKMRASLVVAKACAHYAKEIGLGVYVLCGHAQVLTSSMLADVFESVCGAIFEDGGFDATSAFFEDKVAHHAARLLEAPNRNWKGELQDCLQTMGRGIPEYSLVEVSGPDHEKVFKCSVQVFTQDYYGTGRTKKAAEQEAAKSFLTTTPRGYAY